MRRGQLRLQTGRVVAISGRTVPYGTAFDVQVTAVHSEQLPCLPSVIFFALYLRVSHSSVDSVYSMLSAWTAFLRGEDGEGGVSCGQHKELLALAQLVCLPMPQPETSMK